MMNNPGIQLLMALCDWRSESVSREEKGALLQKLEPWIRSLSPDHPNFRDKEAISADLLHLGFFKKDGTLRHDIVEAARAFLKENLDDAPNYHRFWRHLRAFEGKLSAENPDADYDDYIEAIASWMDEGIWLQEFSSRIAEAEQNGMEVPTHALSRAHMMLDLIAPYNEKERRKLDRPIDDRGFNWFPTDNGARALRELLKDQRYGLSETEVNAWLEDQGSAGALRQIRSLFGQGSKAQTLRDLRILDANWNWSEVGFQRYQKVLLERAGSDDTISLSLVKWTIHERHHSDQPIPLAWTLMNDTLDQACIHRAKRLASIALSGGILGQPVSIEDTITPEQIQQLRHVGQWLHGADGLKNWSALYWLGLLSSSATRGFDWENWKQICGFIYDKTDTTPNPDLIKDWQDGIVTFEGKGRHQVSKPQVFLNAKIGRNDPCPCSSGKKFKKCCGR